MRGGEGVQGVYDEQYFCGERSEPVRRLRKRYDGVAYSRRVQSWWLSPMAVGSERLSRL